MTTEYDIAQLAQTYLDKGACIRPVNAMAKYVKKKNYADDISEKYFEKCMRAIDMDELVRRYNPHISAVPKKTMDPVYGAIYGDIAGSAYEMSSVPLTPEKDYINNKSVFTDDTVLTIATMSALTHIKNTHAKQSFSVKHINNYCTIKSKTTDIFGRKYREYAQKYPHAGYGPGFMYWVQNNVRHGSNGNGAAMRISPIAAIGADYKTTARLAVLSAVSTHDHIEGVKGAVIETICIWMALCGCSIDEIFEYMRDMYRDSLFQHFTYEEAKSIHTHQVQCQFSVPAAIIAVREAFMMKKTLKNAVSYAISVGLDTDTNACIAGAVAAAISGVSEGEKLTVKCILDENLKKVLDMS